MVLPPQICANQIGRLYDYGSSENFWAIKFGDKKSAKNVHRDENQHTITQNGATSLSSYEPLSFSASVNDEEEEHRDFHPAREETLHTQPIARHPLYPPTPRRGGQARRTQRVRRRDRIKLRLQSLKLHWRETGSMCKSESTTSSKSTFSPSLCTSPFMYP